MSFGQAHVRLVQVGAAIAAAALVAGCGNNYRPVITPTNPSGPAAQPQAFAVVVSAPSPSTPGIATLIDYSGDTVMAEVPLGPDPSTFTVDILGGNGYTLNSDGTLTFFPITSTLQENKIVYTTLSGTAEPLNLFASSTEIWVTDLCSYDPSASPCPWDNNPQSLDFSGVDVFTGSPRTFLRSIPLAPTPMALTGGNFAQRVYGISQGNSPVTSGNGTWNNIASAMACNISPSTVALSGVNGEADGIETSSFSVSSQIPLGYCPVFAVESSDGNRLFVLNRGGDAVNPGGSITVINVQNNALDGQFNAQGQCVPFQNQDGHWVTCHPSIPLPAGPVYAEYNSATQQLVVANYDSNSISIVDVSLDEYGNDANTYANNNCTTYAACGAITGGFGTTYTVAVGKNPASVAVLYDGSRAYTANQADGTVSIVNLSSHTVEKTALPVMGHPRNVVSVQNSSYGKVYAASPDSPYLTIIRTDEDIVDTTVLVEGNVLDVRVTSSSATPGSSNDGYVSRVPGYGQPCNLPLSEFTPVYSPDPAVEALQLADCRVQDPSLLK
jgi:DNA-binding beta-propeller fold protein YncE